MFFMLYKGIIVSFVTFYLTGVSSGSHCDLSSCSDNDRQAGIGKEEPPTKAHRSEKLSQTQRMAVHFTHLLKSNNITLNKTYLHKFIYFANGLHYSIFNKPMLENFSFEAHQYGPFVNDVSQHYEKFFNTPLTEDNKLSDSDKSICDYTFNALKSYRSGQLSDFTHESETPWTETRKTYNDTFWNKPIHPELDKKYFQNQANIKRFFLDPLLQYPEKFKSSSDVAQRLLEDDITNKLDKFDSALKDNRFDDVRGLVEQLVALYPIANQFFLNFKNVQEGAFVSSLQIPIEGKLSSQLFTEDFIRNGQLDLFYDHSFRMRVAISAGLNDLSAIHYLQQIFETLSNNSEDYAAQKAQKIQSRLEGLAKKILDKGMTTSSNWQDAYDHSLAHFYLANYNDAIIWMKDALKYKDLPERYRRDILHRAFYITNDSEYIRKALSNRFQDFYIQKATTETLAEQAFICYETAIMDCDLSEAYFKAGRMILRGNYTVPKTSPLWNKMAISADNIQLGKALLEKSIKKGVSEALTYYVESYLYDQDIEKKLEAYDLAKGMPFAQHQKGELLESEYKLLEAKEAYLEAGELLGYPDAIRLSSIEDQRLLSEKRCKYKQRLLEELYGDYNNYVQEE